MGIVELLNEYPFLVERINGIHKDIAELRERQRDAEDSLKATKLTDMPKNPNITDQVAELVTKIMVKYVEEITKLLNQELDLMTQKVRTENLLKELTPKEYTVIKLRHFEGLKFYQIGKKIFLGKSQTWELHQRIIKKLEAKNRTERTEWTKTG